jgi:hypothetical protein
MQAMNPETIKKLDKYVRRPCARADLINSGMEYLMQEGNEYILEHFVKMVIERKRLETLEKDKIHALAS